MTARAISRWVVAATVLLASALLSGCPIPLPAGYESGSRENLGEGVPDFIVQGKTTRAEVLLALGAADGRAADEHWLSFGAQYGRGGVIFILGRGGLGAERFESRRLVVYFDEQGVVERAQFDRKGCTHLVPDDGKPCLDPVGRDLPLLRRIR